VGYPSRMRILRVAVALALCTAVAGPAVAGPESPPTEAGKALEVALDIESELVGALAKVRRYSVSVLHFKKLGQPLPDTTEKTPVLVSVGSGVIVQEKGLWILTNVHVVDGAADLKVVTLDGTRYDVDVVDTIAKYDIALLGFRAGPPKGLKGVTLGKGETALDEGNWVLATGNPFFLANDGRSVATLGVISGLDRILGSDYHYDRAIQHDAEVNPGNSGGPLWNSKGQLIGINGMIASRPTEGADPSNTGCSFSIPVRQIAQFFGQLIDPKRDAQSGNLGVVCETCADKDGKPVGAVVTQADVRVFGNTKNPILKDDVIVKIVAGAKTYPIRTAADLTNALALLPAGTELKVTYLRGKKSLTWTGSLASS
jgi:serine protease Do